MDFKDLKAQINKLSYDEYGRPSGVLLLNKQIGITAHDLVDQTRHTLNTRKVGHAGALDSFSSGLMLILIGKATKISNDLMFLDKTYRARIVLGIATQTQDPEGQPVKVVINKFVERQQLEATIKSFIGNYPQHVSPFSSVKVGGQKLRKLLRDPKYTWEIIWRDEKKYIKLTVQSGQDTFVEIPIKNVSIFSFKLLDEGKLSASELPFLDLSKQVGSDQKFQYLDVSVHCSKGTYIRQLGEDFGAKLGLPAALATLTRTGLGEFTLADATDLSAVLPHS
jgi:tRNA pseudouridine55 synthase